MQGNYSCHSHGCVYRWTQVDHNDGQKRALGGQMSCGDPGRCAQTRGMQVQHVPHGLRSQRGWDQEGTRVAAQHRVVARPNEAMCQGCCRHAAVACDCVGFCPMVGARPNVVLFKFATSENYQAVLQGRKGLVGTKLGLDEDLMPTQ